MNCLNCGTILDENATFCMVCGTPIVQQSSQSARPVYYDQVYYGQQNGYPYNYEQPAGVSQPPEYRYDQFNNSGQTSQNNNMLDNSADLVNSKKATSSMVWGIVTLSVNTIMICSMVLNGPFLFGGIWCFGPIKGIVDSKAGWNSSKHSRAVAGRVCSIIALVFGGIMLTVGIIVRVLSD